MDKSGRPRGREEHITGGSHGVHKRGEGLHMGGPVGDAHGYSQRREGAAGDDRGILEDVLGGQTGSSAGMEHMVEELVMDTVAGGRRGSKKPLAMIIAVAALLLFGGGTLLSGVFSDMGSGMPQDHSIYSAYSDSQSGGGSGLWQSGGGGGNTGSLNTEVAAGAREKRTLIQGNNRDTVTIMVYMCGTDLESKGGMATSDLQEMAAADIGEKVNLIVYTGGCSQWRNQVVSSQVNQVYQIKDGGLTCLVEDAGSVSMTNPGTLTQFIKWTAENFPANRNELILWDHGGGSISGYGYDQKYPNSGSMSLPGINTALKNAGISFDFIGFDACLMATMENALMLSQYADYLIASEETEPGVGWYYTNWLTALSENTSMSTLEIGKQIVDDFVNVCAQKCAGDQTTLSVIDLAELSGTAPEALTAFSKATGQLIQNQEYQVVSNARSKAREFARSVGIDQVDLIHLSDNMNTKEGKRLSEVLRSAVKYNLTSDNMTNAYGISIYFPYKKVSSVDTMVQTYEQIGMDEEYTRCIQEFASLEVGGQVVSGGTSSPLPSLLGSLAGDGSFGGQDMISELLGGLLSGDFGSIAGLDGSNTGFLSGRMLEDSAEYLTENRFDASQLVWTEEGGNKLLKLKAEQWDLIQNLELNVFYDDGGGYIDLGMDNLYHFDNSGNLVGSYDHTWIAINGQPVAYYFLDEVDDGENYTITGRVPAMLNDQRVDLMLVFDQDNPYGYIAGARINYDRGETDTVARGLTELQPGDRLDFICDYYSYDGDFRDNYYLGETMTVSENMSISNVEVGTGDVQATYRLTDIYNRHYWTPVM